ncbi:hypothetical protein [Anaeromyxobacter oryzae]|uniref:Uncharacterized protein n=1 Tax=Anaeromyxobacter oryzae TaxID=2918170 RepID=A0ABN6MJ96_9BACT|nr:hypothetical protein [Anaeromyxobacter oryzae]BDG01082.1 hypothetical protein AMOR_00780 [Anaeromyxobacter oryzae]
MSIQRLAVALVLAALSLPAAAGERVYLLRSQEHPDVTPACPAGDTVRLGAYLYAPRSRASDGLVMKDAGRPVGTAIGCGKILTYTPFDPKVKSPFSMVFALDDGTFTAQGTCEITSLTFPVPGVPAPLLLVGCALKVNPDAALGVVNGVATSASVFTPVALPGYGTGSFWTLQLYTND